MPRLPKLVTIVLYLLVLLFLMAAAWYWQAISSPADKSAQTQLITISPDSRGYQIASQLKREHLIRDPLAFYIYALLHGKAGTLQAGLYQLSASQTVAQIITAISGGAQAEQRLTALEGSTITAIADKVEAGGFDTRANFLTAASQAGVTEGYLFPDTYYFQLKTRSAEIVKAMRQNFDKKFTSDLQQKAAQQGLSAEQAVILASIVEREANNPADRRLVAGIFEKRLKQGIPLQSDPVLQYALGGFDHVLTAIDLASSSPYNLRIHKGLPPTAICSPGLDALIAVGAPTGSDYLYFITGKDGQMHYARTLAEHNANVAKYLK